MKFDNTLTTPLGFDLNVMTVFVSAEFDDFILSMTEKNDSLTYNFVDIHCYIIDIHILFMNFLVVSASTKTLFQNVSVQGPTSVGETETKLEA